jgi:ComF family protein
MAWSIIGQAAGWLIDRALPPTCAGCRREGQVLCERCGGALASRLGEPGGALLGLPAALPAPLVQLEWCAPFRGVVRAAILRLKYDGEQRLAGPLGSALAARWREAGAGGDLIVPVPVHQERARERGYDQAALLAATAAGRLRLPTAAVLERRRATVPQYQLDRSRRAANVSGAFALVTGAGQHVHDRWIVLVDDVATTGATLAACGAALLAAGALAVSGLTVAREH